MISQSLKWCLQIAPSVQRLLIYVEEKAANLYIQDVETIKCLSSWLSDCCSSAQNYLN